MSNLNSKPPWRESAAVFILARDLENLNGKYDYKILTFIRTEKTSFFGKNVSLPGGAVDYELDFCPSWKNFLDKNNLSFESIEHASKKPLIYQKRDFQLSREISLRLTAMRETFEEVGVLFHKTTENSNSKFTSCFHSKLCDVPHWQNEIHQKRNSLKNFFEQFDILPDMLKLYDWSVWLTPTTHNSKRYETAYFIAAIESIPPIYAESYEVQSFSWNTPGELLEMHEKKLIWLPPPIYYECHRFLNQTKIDDILDFAAKRSGDIPLIFPLAYQLKGGSLTLIYPGDDLYSKHPNLYETVHDMLKFSGFTYKELAENCKNFCRLEIKDMYARNFLCNYDDNLLPATTLISKNKL